MGTDCLICLTRVTALSDTSGRNIEELTGYHICYCGPSTQQIIEFVELYRLEHDLYTAVACMTA